MQNPVVTRLLVQFALLLAYVFQIIDNRVQTRGKQRPQLPEQGLRGRAISDCQLSRARLLQKRPQFALEELVQLHVGVLVHVQP